MILVVEDEPSISEVVGLYLRRAGFEVVAVSDGQAALDVMARRSVELVVLDLMLPKVDGLEVARRVRRRGETPIIMLTARGDEADRIAGLELGADDYVVKPFSPQELVSRVRAVLRRARGASENGARIPAGLRWPGDRPSNTPGDGRWRGSVLTAKEFELLWALASNPRRAFSREQLLVRAWGSADYIDPSTVTVHVRRLREKVERRPRSLGISSLCGATAIGSTREPPLTTGARPVMPSQPGQDPHAGRRLLLFAGGVVVAFALALLLFDVLLDPSPSDLRALTLYLAASAGVSLVVGYTASRSGWMKGLPHVSWTLLASFLLTGALAIANRVRDRPPHVREQARPALGLGAAGLCRGHLHVVRIPDRGVGGRPPGASEPGRAGGGRR